MTAEIDKIGSSDIYAINPNLDIKRIADILKDAIHLSLEVRGADEEAILHDYILSLYDEVFPNGSRPATAEGYERWTKEEALYEAKTIIKEENRSNHDLIINQIKVELDTAIIELMAGSSQDAVKMLYQVQDKLNTVFIE